MASSSRKRQRNELNDPKRPPHQIKMPRIIHEDEECYILNTEPCHFKDLVQRCTGKPATLSSLPSSNISTLTDGSQVPNEASHAIEMARPPDATRDDIPRLFPELSSSAPESDFPSGLGPNSAGSFQDVSPGPHVNGTNDAGSYMPSPATSSAFMNTLNNEGQMPPAASFSTAEAGNVIGMQTDNRNEHFLPGISSADPSDLPPLPETYFCLGFDLNPVGLYRDSSFGLDGYSGYINGSFIPDPATIASLSLINATNNGGQMPSAASYATKEMPSSEGNNQQVAHASTVQGMQLDSLNPGISSPGPKALCGLHGNINNTCGNFLPNPSSFHLPQPHNYSQRLHGNSNYRQGIFMHNPSSFFSPQPHTYSQRLLWNSIYSQRSFMPNQPSFVSPLPHRNINLTEGNFVPRPSRPVTPHHRNPGLHRNTNFANGNSMPIPSRVDPPQINSPTMPTDTSTDTFD